jgi:hypothetical protein
MVARWTRRQIDRAVRIRSRVGDRSLRTRHMLEWDCTLVPANPADDGRRCKVLKSIESSIQPERRRCGCTVFYLGFITRNECGNVPNSQNTHLQFSPLNRSACDIIIRNQRTSALTMTLTHFAMPREMYSSH